MNLLCDFRLVVCDKATPPSSGVFSCTVEEPGNRHAAFGITSVGYVSE